MDPSYNSPLLRRASAARAPSTGSFYDVTDHIAALTTSDPLCRFTHTGHGRALKFHRSAQLSIPAIRARVGALRTFLDGRTQEDRACAPVSSDLSGNHHAANARDNEFSRLMLARGLFSQELAAPLRTVEYTDARAGPGILCSDGGPRKLPLQQRRGATTASRTGGGPEE